MARSALLLLLWGLFCVSSVVGQQIVGTASVTINGVGSPAADPLLRSWENNYPFSNNRVTIKHSSLASSAVATEMTDRLTYGIFFAATEDPNLTPEQLDAAGLKLFPMATSMVVMGYRLTALPTNYTLILDQPTIAAIYEGTITTWDDAAIQALNPTVAASLPAASIKVVCRTDPSAITYAFTKALSQVVPSFASSVGYGNQVTFLAPTILPAASDVATATTILANDQSIGYIAGPIAINQVVKFAKMYTVNGTTITANSASLVAAATDGMQLTGWTGSQTLDLINTPTVATAWPICYYSYFVFSINTSYPQECELLQQFITFFSWTQNWNSVRSAASALGYEALQIGGTKRVFDLIHSASCLGQQTVQSSTVYGNGISAMQPAHNAWTRYYTEIYDIYTAFSNYVPLVTAQAIAQLRTYDVDFTAVAGPFLASDIAGVDDWLSLPAIVTGIVFFYNTNATLGNYSLIFDADLVVKIFSGQVTTFSDPAFLALNPEVSSLLQLETTPFTVVILANNPTNAKIKEFLQDSLGPQAGIFNYTTFLYPPVYTNPAVKIYGTPASAATAMATLPNAIGYVPVANALAGAPKAGRARLVNAQGTPSDANAASFEAAAFDFENSFDSNNYADLVYAPGVNSYPISTYEYYAIRSQSIVDCEKGTRFMDYLVWTQTGSDAQEIAAALGYGIVSSRVHARNLELLASVYCDGRQVLSLAGCLQGGVICSSNGGCVDGACVCDDGFEGKYCQSRKSSSSDDTGLIVGAVLGSVFGVILFCCLLCLLVLAIVAIILLLRARKGGYRRMDKMWLVDWNELEVGHQIGSGSLHHATWKGVDVAVKLLGASVVGEEGNAEVTTVVPITKQLQSQFVDDASIMTTLRHPNVVLLTAACSNPPALVLPYMSMGSVYDVLHNQHITNITVQRKIKMATQAAEGMTYLHSLDIIHRDLKSLNLLVDEDWNVKVSDFGLTLFKEQLSAEKQKVSPGSKDEDQGLSVLWTAPELFEDSVAYSKQSDVYSFGIILWEIATRKNPYEGMSPPAVAYAVVQNKARPPMPDEGDMPEEYLDLMRTCWEQEPADRPDFEEIAGTFAMIKHAASQSSRADEEDSFAASHSRGYDDPRSTKSAKTGSSGYELLEFGAEMGVPPPQGSMALVFSDITRAASIWEVAPAAMAEATKLHNAILRECLEEFEGYEVALMMDQGGVGGEGSFCTAFQKPGKALAWCIAAQERLLAAKWPSALLKVAAAAEERDNQNGIIFKGLRVRMGINYGTPRAEKDPKTRRVEYLGGSVNVAAHLATIAQGGQILLSEEFYQKVKDKDIAKKKGQIVKLGKLRTGDSEGNDLNVIYEFKPTAVKSRSFGSNLARSEGNKKKEKRKGSTNSFSDSDSDSDLELGDDPQHKEDTYLTSANLCRWVINAKQLQMKKKIGSGNFGVVYQANWKGVEVAYKKFGKQQLSEDEMLSLRAEVATLSEMSHPNLVLVIGACLKYPNFGLVTEYMPNGSLKDILHDKSVSLDWNKKLTIGRSIAQALEHLHSHKPPIIHRDLKPSNVLIDEHWNVKVTDFGFIKIKEENTVTARNGNPTYTAPELLKGEEYDETVDIYSLGMILWELLTRTPAYEGQNFMAVTMDVLKGLRPSIPPKTPSEYAKIIKKSWVSDSRKRPSLSTILKYFASELGNDAV